MQKNFKKGEIVKLVRGTAGTIRATPRDKIWDKRGNCYWLKGNEYKISFPGGQSTIAKAEDLRRL